MLIGFVQGYEQLKWGISKLNPLCNGPILNFKNKKILWGNRKLSCKGEVVTIISSIKSEKCNNTKLYNAVMEMVGLVHKTMTSCKTPSLQNPEQP